MPLPATWLKVNAASLYDSSCFLAADAVCPLPKCQLPKCPLPRPPQEKPALQQDKQQTQKATPHEASQAEPVFLQVETAEPFQSAWGGQRCCVQDSVSPTVL